MFDTPGVMYVLVAYTISMHTFLHVDVTSGGFQLFKRSDAVQESGRPGSTISGG